MYHPWRSLRHRPHRDLAWADLPVELSAYIEGSTITMARDLSQVQRRVTLTQELIHDEWGVPHEDDPAEEARLE